MKKRIITSLTALMLLTMPITTNAAWQQTNGRWWYTNNSQVGYSVGNWEYINGAWYHFDNQGYMQVGWLYLNGTWYYLNSNGAMLTGWYQIGGNWYYSSESGAMLTNQWIGNYYVGANGAMATNTWIGNYYVGANGAWQTGGWRQNSTGWWYQNIDGSYPSNQWQHINGAWYYFDGNGYMLANTWIGNYYVGSNGAMATNTWIGNYYVGADGAWQPDHVRANAEGYHNDMAYEVFQLTNQERAKKTTSYAKPLIWNETLAEIARIRAKEIATSFSHTRPNGGSFDEMIPYKIRTAGENLNSGALTASSAIDAWLHSPMHKGTMLNSAFSEMGTASYTENGVTYWVQIFMELM